MCITVFSVDLRAPTNVVATVRSCNTVTLQWTQPSEPNDITTSVSCTPPSPGCAECTTSPCTITGLNPSSEYEFTVTLNSKGCRASMNSTTARTKGEVKCVVGTCIFSVRHLTFVVYRHLQNMTEAVQSSYYALCYIIHIIDHRGRYQFPP